MKVDSTKAKEAIRLLKTLGYRIQRRITCTRCDGDGYISVSNPDGDYTTSCEKYEWEEVEDGADD